MICVFNYQTCPVFLVCIDMCVCIWFGLSSEDNGWKRHRGGGSGAKFTWPQLSIWGEKQTHLPCDWCSSLVPLYFFGHSGRCWATCAEFVKLVMWCCVTTFRPFVFVVHFRMYPSLTPIFFTLQHLLTAFGAMVSIPLILSEGLCLQHDSLTQSHLINSIFFVSGLCTLLQVTFGVR